ncbi:MAG: ATP-dependent protease subunit HslV [Deltaproteobacteria bacterium]|nr:ATP-dependent protease subunit HslV [Deltaproteobacteria bacterium]
MIKTHSTTILAVNHNNRLVFGGDGQVTVNNTVMKHSAVKIRRSQNGKVLAGFAGSAADSFSLFERFEAKLGEYGGNLPRAAVELAKDWRSDRFLRKLEAMMIVGNGASLFLLSGVGDVIQPDDGVIGIGSGGTYALAAARALIRYGQERIDARQVVEQSLKIAAELCPFTNDSFVFEELSCD